MNEVETLKFNDKELFNYKSLHQYAEEGQKLFLGYLIIKELWEIQDKCIVFPSIKTQQEVQKAIEEYNDTTIRANLVIQQRVAEEITMLGEKEFKQKVEENLKKLDNKNKKKEKDVR